MRLNLNRSLKLIKWIKREFSHISCHMNTLDYLHTLHCYDKFSLESVQVYFTNVPTYINKAGPKQRKSYTRSIVTMAILTISNIQTTWLRKNWSHFNNTYNVHSFPCFPGLLKWAYNSKIAKHLPSSQKTPV